MQKLKNSLVLAAQKGQPGFSLLNLDRLLCLSLAGPQGKVGERGPQGLQGKEGATGIQGKQGDVGATGARGAPGVPGLQGPQGLPGEVGKAGPIGATGARGIKVSYEFKVMEMTLALSKGQTGKKAFFAGFVSKFLWKGLSFMIFNTTVILCALRLEDLGLYSATLSLFYLLLQLFS